MIPKEFDYVAPATLEEALAALRDGGEDAKVLAGGHSLIPMMKLRLAAPARWWTCGKSTTCAGAAPATGRATRYRRDGHLPDAELTERRRPAGRVRGQHRRRPGAGARHHRRQPGPRRPRRRPARRHLALDAGLKAAGQGGATRDRPPTSSPTCSPPRWSRARS